MEIKTSELSGAALDWAVCTAVGDDLEWLEHCGCYGIVDVDDPIAFDPMPKYSTDWGKGGLLVDDLRVTIEQSSGDIYACVQEDQLNGEFGPTALIAACRAIVAAKLGDTVTVPNELEG